MAATSDSAMSVNGLAVTELFDRIEALAQELKNIILEHYKVLIPEGAIVINTSYKPPPQLQLDRESRAKAIDIYYGRPAIFHLDFAFDSDIELLDIWLSALSPSTQAKIQEIRLVRDGHNAHRAYHYLSYLEHQSGRRHLKMGVLKMKRWSPKAQAWKWMSWPEMGYAVGFA